ncbi:MAG TPA: hypothetical protein VID48_06300 [Solirubrobacteraceae bacterium]|jgi:hypothetical protein
MSKRKRIKSLPWAALLQASVLVGRRWWGLSQKERARLVSLLRDSRGRPGNLSARERLELSKLIGGLQLKSAARELGGLFSGSGKRRRRH